MKQFLRRLLLFISPPIIIATFLEFSLRKIPNDYVYKKNYLDTAADKCAVLVLGSSHAYYDVLPQYFTEKGFNAAHVSQSLSYDLSIYTAYQEKLSQLKYLILPVDYFSLFETLEESAEKWRIKNYNIYYQLPPKGDFVNRFVVTSNFKLNIERCYNFYSDPNYTEQYCSVWGNGNHSDTASEKQLLLDAQNAITRHTIKDTQWLSYNVLALDSIVRIAQAHHTKIIVYSSPACDAYTRLLEPKQYQLLQQTMAKFCAKYPQVANYNFLKPQLFSNNDFFDADHLNTTGAKKLSLVLDSLMRK